MSLDLVDLVLDVTLDDIFDGLVLSHKILGLAVCKFRQLTRIALCRSTRYGEFCRLTGFSRRLPLGFGIFQFLLVVFAKLY